MARRSRPALVARFGRSEGRSGRARLDAGGVGPPKGTGAEGARDCRRKCNHAPPVPACERAGAVLEGL
jgi:hypothetical protein